MYGAINDMKICEYGASKLGEGANKSMFIKNKYDKRLCPKALLYNIK